MDIETLRRHWGLLLALLLLVMVGVIVSATIYRRSSRGQLRSRAKSLRTAEARRSQAHRSVKAAERRLGQLESRAAAVKPRQVDEAKGALGDARALAKIADDQVLVAANHLRRVIYQEYPPSRHEKLRQKYLPDDGPDQRPFSF